MYALLDVKIPYLICDVLGLGENVQMGSDSLVDERHGETINVRKIPDHFQQLKNKCRTE